MKTILTCSLQLNTIPRSLDAAGTAAVIQSATESWAAATGLTLPWMRFMGTSASDIVFRFGDLTAQGDDVVGLTQDLDAGNHLVTFDSHSLWSLPPTGWLAWLRRIFQQGGDLKTVALHEIGHALGLGHNDEWDSVMNPAPEAEGLANAPSARDAARVRALFFSPQ